MMSPCKDCTKRCTACHDNCAEYKEYTEQLHAEKNWMKSHWRRNSGWWSSEQVARFARTDKHANSCGLRSYR